MEDAPVGLIAADDLEAYGEAVGGEAGRDGDGGVVQYRDVVAGAHPVDVVAELLAVDFGDIGLVDVEGGDLRRGKDEVFVLREEFADALD